MEYKPQIETDIAPVKRTLISALSPAMRWALLSCLLVALAFGVVNFILNLRFYGLLPALAAGLVFLAAVVVLAVLMTLLFAALKKVRWQTHLVVFASVFLCLTTVAALVYILPLLIFCLCAVYFAVMCASGSYRKLSKPKKILRYSLLGLFSVLTVFMLVLTLWPGPSLKPGDRPDKAILALPYADMLLYDDAAVVDDPSILGGYNYSEYYYATPGQKITPYPGQNVIAAPSVDASDILKGFSCIRKLQLGFGPDALPLNAQVWLPEGTGPFPLALIVHGNHDSADRSDGGYAYLGELLASRGIIAASVDENFLNLSPLYNILVFAGLKKENSTRAFILLEHLRQWHEWNADISHPFFGKADFDNIALIGHSRGGEAVALAAAFAELEYYPDNGAVTFDYPFSIKTVVAIAPVHRQYDPAGLEVSLKNVNYLVLHGGHDMDVLSFMGANMYHRADVSGYGVKAQIWMLHANHGQFNTVWGQKDLPGLMNLMAYEKLLMPPEEQQHAAKVFISAFLESTLHGKEEYNALFRSFAHGEEWLPPTQYITGYADKSTVLLDSFDSGFDLGMSSSKLATYSAQGFDAWTQTELPGKLSNSNRVLMLQWGSTEYAEKKNALTPIYKTEFVKGAVSVGDKLYVSLCSGKEKANEPDVSFRINLTDSYGHVSIMSVNDFGGVVNPVNAPIFKPLFSFVLGVREPVLQMICIPTAQFDGLSENIVSMEWIMDVGEISKTGQTLYVDDLQVEKISVKHSDVSRQNAEINSPISPNSPNSPNPHIATLPFQPFPQIPKRIQGQNVFFIMNHRRHNGFLGIELLAILN
jgi:hypothetical protein